MCVVIGVKDTTLNPFLFFLIPSHRLLFLSLSLIAWTGSDKGIMRKSGTRLAVEVNISLRSNLAQFAVKLSFGMRSSSTQLAVELALNLRSE